MRVALIGTGGWAGHHARIFSGRADTELCAIVGRNEDRVQARTGEFGGRGYTDIARMLEREKPDLVSICLPNLHHFAATLQVIESGFPLLVEKPLVFDLAEADHLLNEASRRNLFFAINFNHRFARPLRMARAAIAAGHLGDLGFASWRFGGEGSHAHHPHANLIETQCHGFDLLEWLCGPIVALSAELNEAHTTVALNLRFASGAVGAFLGTYDSSYAYPGAQRLELNGTQGRIVIEDTVRRFEFQKNGCETAEVWQAGYFNDWDREFQRTFDTHVDALLKALRQGEPPPIHAQAGRRALQLAHASIQSSTEGRRVEVPS